MNKFFLLGGEFLALLVEELVDGERVVCVVSGDEVGDGAAGQTQRAADCGRRGGGEEKTIRSFLSFMMKASLIA